MKHQLQVVQMPKGYKTKVYFRNPKYTTPAPFAIYFDFRVTSGVSERWNSSKMYTNLAGFVLIGQASIQSSVSLLFDLAEQTPK